MVPRLDSKKGMGIVIVEADPICLICKRTDVRLYGGVVAKETSRFKWEDVVEVYCNEHVPDSYGGYFSRCEPDHGKSSLFRPLIDGGGGLFFLPHQGHQHDGCSAEQRAKWVSTPDVDPRWRWRLDKGWVQEGSPQAKPDLWTRYEKPVGA